MWQMLWPIIIVVSANTFYNICTKSTPEHINSFASLTITYFVAAAACLGLFFLTSEQKNIIYELSKANWTSWILGFSVVALEFGYICIYRAGWKMGLASLVANICLACILLFIGVLIYQETLNPKQLLGIGICLFGLFLLGK